LNHNPKRLSGVFARWMVAGSIFSLLSERKLARITEETLSSLKTVGEGDS